MNVQRNNFICFHCRVLFKYLVFHNNTGQFGVVNKAHLVKKEATGQTCSFIVAAKMIKGGKIK